MKCVILELPLILNKLVKFSSLRLIMTQRRDHAKGASIYDVRTEGVRG